jgi:hypothetical protein
VSLILLRMGVPMGIVLLIAGLPSWVLLLVPYPPWSEFLAFSEAVSFTHQPAALLRNAY